MDLKQTLNGELEGLVVLADLHENVFNALRQEKDFLSGRGGTFLGGLIEEIPSY